MVELVIKIPEKFYEGVKYGRSANNLINNAIKNGIPLPKSHGRIVDISKLQYMKVLNKAIHGRLSWVEAIRRIKNSAPTIVEADKESEE